MHRGGRSNLLAGMHSSTYHTSSITCLYVRPRHRRCESEFASADTNVDTDAVFSGGPYNALKVDVWSVGATVWETAESEPPFADVQDPRLMGDRWPSLHQPEIYSRSFHEFLRLCSEPSSSRPDPSELLNVR